MRWKDFDSLQLAIAIDLRNSGLVDVIIASDHRLCRVASLLGFSAVNPGKSGPLLVGP